MELYYLFLILVSSACGKLVPLLPDPSLRLPLDINKDNPATNHIRTTSAPNSKEANDNAIDSDIAHNPETNGSDGITPSKSTDRVDNGTALILTRFIKEGKIAEARNACRVDPELFLGFESYSGFLTVNETYNSNLFFWYFPVVGKPVNETPWIVWLQGGPGASSLTGLFDEIGPIHYTGYGTLRKNPHTWLANHSLLFIDNPVGAGYSFTDDPAGFTQDMETYTRHLHSTMQQFIQIFPELQTAPLFIAGESYAGKYVPALAARIHHHHGRPGGAFNLTGVILGNALVDPEVISHIAHPFQYFGLMDETQLNAMQPLLTGFQADIVNNRSVEAKEKWGLIISCLLSFSYQTHAYNFLQDNLNVGKYISFLDKSEVKRALHVGDIEFSFVNGTVTKKLAPDFLSNTKPLMEELLEHYRVLIYCGHLDQMLPCLYTSKNHRTWKWSGSEEYLKAVRHPYMVNGRLAGYHKTGGRLTEVVFRGAGHMVPLDAPAAARALLTDWTAGAMPGSHAAAFLFAISSIHLNDTIINF